MSPGRSRSWPGRCGTPSYPDKPANLLAFEVEHLGRRFLNPLLRIRCGRTVSRPISGTRSNEPSIIHWHGLKLDSNNDGHPHYAVAGGATYDYHFTVANRAATYWYHPHPHHHTGKQVYLGLDGLVHRGGRRGARVAGRRSTSAWA